MGKPTQVQVGQVWQSYYGQRYRVLSINEARVQTECIGPASPGRIEWTSIDGYLFTQGRAVCDNCDEATRPEDVGQNADGALVCRDCLAKFSAKATDVLAPEHVAAARRE